MMKPNVKRGEYAPFGMLGMPMEQQDGYTGALPGYWPGGFNGFGGYLSAMLNRGQPAAPAKPKGPALKPMPDDIKALTSMTSGPDGKSFDYDGFLGGLFGKKG
jgi:hypothetical protein